MEWILVIFVHAGILSQKDSMALVTVPGFNSDVQCQKAGKESENLGKSTTKDVKFVCLQRSK